MSPKCEVANLSSLALYSIVTQITHALSDDEGIYYSEVVEYHQYTPPEILEDILSEILSNESLDAGTRFSCFEVLLKNNVRKLEIGMFPYSYYDRILEIIACNGTGLAHLNLKGVWLKDKPELLCDILMRLTQLKVLHIPHMVDDNVLQCVANCSNLKVLNISGECTFTNDGLREFCRTLAVNKSQIKILDIGSFGEEDVPHECVADIIESLPQLATLNSYSFVGKSLLHIYKKNKAFTCKLKYIHDTFTNSEICDAIVNTCPTLENLYFDSPDNSVIQKINKFHNLNCLKLNKFPCDQLHKLLPIWGECLRALKLSHGRGIMDLSIVAKSCPNLTSLDLYKMEFLNHTTNDPFYKLQELEVLYNEISSPSLKYILERAPELKKIEIGEAVKLSDGDLYRLCADMCLLCLEEVWFSNARYLSVNAVELLMGHCPRLRVLGQLSGWNISADDADFMRAVIQSTNTDLTLLPVGIFGY